MKKLTDEERRERNRKSCRRYNLKNKDKIRERNCLYYLKNKEKNKERSRLYYLNNKDKIKEWKRRYYLKNKYQGGTYKVKDKMALLNPIDMTKREIEALEAQIARLKAKPLEELIYKRA